MIMVTAVIGIVYNCNLLWSVVMAMDKAKAMI